MKPTLTDAMALVSWSRVRTELIDDLGGISTHEAVVVAVNQRPSLSGVLVPCQSVGRYVPWGGRNVPILPTH